MAYFQLNPKQVGLFADWYGRGGGGEGREGKGKGGRRQIRPLPSVISV